MTRFFSIMLCLFVGIAIVIGFLFLPSYLKLKKDMKQGRKMPVSIPVKEIDYVHGIPYAVLRPNPYRIQRLPLPVSQQVTELTGQELTLYITPNLHTVLEIV